MSLLTVKPTKIDERIARTVARKTNRRAETVARGMTWGADENILLALAAAGWVLSRTQGEPLRRAGNHALLVAATASLLPHVLKTVFDQTRPDRKTVLGMFTGSRSPASAKMPFRRDTPCTWGRWHRRRDRCRLGPAGRSGRWR